VPAGAHAPWGAGSGLQLPASRPAHLGCTCSGVAAVSLVQRRRRQPSMGIDRRFSAVRLLCWLAAGWWRTCVSASCGGRGCTFTAGAATGAQVGAAVAGETCLRSCLPLAWP
jgi:hypothetical protein